MVNIADTVRKIKDDLPGLLEPHVAACLEPVETDALSNQPQFVWRNRMLDPLTTILLFVQQILHGNTAIHHLRHLSDCPFTSAAYCKARMRLPLTLVEQVSRSIASELVPFSDEACRWRGHRIWRADGSSFSMPDTPDLQKHFGQPGAQQTGCGFPTATTLTLCNAAGLIVRSFALPLRTHEASQLSALYDELEAGDVVVYDRAGCSYAQLALLFMANLHGIIRMHQKQIVSFSPGRKHAGQFPKGQRAGKPTSQWIQRLGKYDQLVRWFKPSSRPVWMTPEDFEDLPDALVLRELRYKVHRKGFRTRSVTLVTTLLDPQAYPAEELAEQYQQRWQIELHFRDLKQTMGMDVLKCKTVDGVRKELAMFMLVYNLVRLVMLRAAQRQQVPLERISFVDALRWLCDARDVNDVCDLVTNPRRPEPVEPRVRKRRPKQYPLMKKPRAELRQDLLSQ